MSSEERHGGANLHCSPFDLSGLLIFRLFGLFRKAKNGQSTAIHAYEACLGETNALSNITNKLHTIHKWNRKIYTLTSEQALISSL